MTDRKNITYLNKSKNTFENANISSTLQKEKWRHKAPQSPDDPNANKWQIQELQIDLMFTQQKTTS